jgi:hypothetical protein
LCRNYSGKLDLYIPATLKRRFSLGSILGKQIYIQKGDFKLTFDKLFKSGNSFVCGVELIPIGLNLAMPTLEAGASVSFNEAHAILGNVGTEVIRKTTKFYGWKLTGNRLGAHTAQKPKQNKAVFQKP